MYLGPYGAAKDLPTLQAHRVTHILVIGPFRPFRPIVVQCMLIIVLPFRMGCPERLLFSHVLSACLFSARWSWRSNFYRITAGCRLWHRDTHCNVGASDRAVRAEREACHAETSTTLPVPRMHRMRTYRHHSLQLCLLELAECWAAVGSMTCVGSLSELQVVDINDDMMENLLPYADTNQHSAILTTDPCRSACLFRVGLTVIKTAA